MDTKEILKKITEKGIKEEIRARFYRIDNAMKSGVQDHTSPFSIKTSIASVRNLLAECDELVEILEGKEVE